MFARLFAVASLAALAVAGPAPLVVRDQCTTGSINCCNSVQNANVVSDVLGLFSLANVLAGVTGQVGLGCSGISALAVTSNSCSAQTVCCSGNTFNGLIQTGCTPINVA